MIDIHIVAKNPQSLHIQEWDVKTLDGTFLGVIEELDDGYTYTDSFGHLTTFFEGEALIEVYKWVADSLNTPLMN